jgi:3',5'-cyclic AMP phosphodiesterase CpdA
MRTIVHLSDLHFGSIDAALLAPLRDRIEALQSHLIVVSGDLTQRARAAQFREARRFLDTLPKPQVVVPGNHDVPLYNVLWRFALPFRNYRRYISKDLEPEFIDDEIAVIGVNTARSLTFKHGRINEEQAARVRNRLCPLRDEMVKIVVTHHPFDVPPDADDDDIVGRAEMVMKSLHGCGADLLLAGHLHTSHTTDTAKRYKSNGASALIVQAGTATSTRSRGEINSFNAIHTQPDALRVDQYRWDAPAAMFSCAKSEDFRRGPDGWTRTERS